MKLKDYIKNLQKLVEANPKAKNFEVIYSSDDEGNWFASVEAKPMFGRFENDGGFDFEADDEDFNAVCIN